MVRRNLTRGLPTAVAAGALIAAGITSATSAATPVASAPRPGTIETIAGGTGGPAPASSVSVQPCGVKFARGRLYIGSTSGLWDFGTPAFAAVYRVNLNGGRLTTVTGQGTQGSGGQDGELASSASVDACNMTMDSAGNLLLADQNLIRVIPAKTGTYYQERMIAGRIYSLPGGYGNTADVEIDPAGNVVIVSAGSPPASSRPPSGETGGQVEVLAERTGTFYGQKMTAGNAYTIAGAPQGGGSGDGFPAVRAYLGYALGTVRLDSAGNLLLADMGAPLGSGQTPPPPSVRVVPDKTGTYYGQHMKAGYLYTIAGGGTQTGDGVPATKAALTEAAAVALDSARNVLIADGYRVRVLAKKTGTLYGQHMKAGYLYTIAGSAASGRFTDGVPARKAVIGANGLAVDSVGNVLVADENDSRVLMIAARSGTYYGRKARAGYLYSVAGNGRVHDSGDGGPAKNAELSPVGVADDRPDHLVVISDQNANVVRVVAGKTGRFFAQNMTAGSIYTLAGNRDTTGKTYSGDGGSARKAGLAFPAGVAADQAGNVLLADYANYRVRVVAARTGTYYGQRMTLGDIYTIAGDGALAYSGDGSPARDAGLGWVRDVTLDRAGNVLLIGGQYEVPGQGPRVRMVAEKAGTYYGEPMKAGDIYTVAGDGITGYSGDGGPATAAAINPYAITADSAGNLVIADWNRIRVVAARTGRYYGQQMIVGDIYTVAGGGDQTGDGVPAAKAVIDARAVAVDPAGNVLAGGYLAVRMVAEKTGTYYGRTVRAGDVYTVAGAEPTSPGPGDGGPANSAALEPAGISVGPAGLLLIADRLYSRIRSVTR